MNVFELIIERDLGRVVIPPPEPPPCDELANADAIFASAEKKQTTEHDALGARLRSEGPLLALLPVSRRAEAAAILERKPDLINILKRCNRYEIDCWTAMRLLGMPKWTSPIFLNGYADSSCQLKEEGPLPEQISPEEHNERDARKTCANLDDRS